MGLSGDRTILWLEAVRPMYKDYYMKTELGVLPSKSSH